MNKNVDKIINSIEDIGITISDNQAEQLYSYYEMLIEKNKVMNLTAITEFDDVVIKHFADSLYISEIIEMQNVVNMIDVGTGAGFPGIPIKIVFPNIKVTLLDSLNKRVNFLNEVIDNLGLTGIEAVHGRAEDFGKNPEYREKYELCVSRAVANLSSLSEYCIPFVSQNGMFVSYKAGDCEEEIDKSKKAIKLLGGKIESIDEVELLDTDISRVFVCIRKKEKTAKKYPRKAGLPAKEPL